MYILCVYMHVSSHTCYMYMYICTRLYFVSLAVCRYVQENILNPGDIHYRQFHKIFEAFKLHEEPEAPPKTTPIPTDDDTMSIAAKSAAAQKKQRDEEAAEEEVREGGREGGR